MAERLPRGKGRQKSLNRQSFILIYIIGILPLILQAGDIPSSSLPPVAIKFQALFQQLREAEQLSREDPSRKASFQLSENEVNNYIHYSLAAQPRLGMNAAVLKFFSHNYVSALVTLDFDVVEHGKPGTIPTMLTSSFRTEIHLGGFSIWHARWLDDIFGGEILFPECLDPRLGHSEGDRGGPGPPAREIGCF